MHSAFMETARPAEARGFIHKRALGALKRAFAPAVNVGLGFIPGGGIVREGLKLAKRQRGPAPGSFFAIPDVLSPRELARLDALRGVGQFPVQLPPTPTITTPAERSVGADFQAVTGAFGMPAMAPFAETRTILDCPPGMVLGKDDLCYPSAVLRRNSQFRKWRSAPRPTITRRDERALTRIDAVQKNLKRLGKKAGLKVTG